MAQKTFLSMQLELCGLTLNSSVDKEDENINCLSILYTYEIKRTPDFGQTIMRTNKINERIVRDV